MEPNAAGAEDVDRWTPRRRRGVLLCVALNMLDGADVLVVSYGAPLLTRDWGLSSQTLGLVFSAGLVGMALGALLIAPLADRFGRKRLVLAALTILSLGMAGGAMTADVAQLIALRLFTGLGIGTTLASITALAHEFAPARHRSFAVALSAAGYPLGAVITGIAANLILPIQGWRGLFVAAGVTSAVMLPLCWLVLPESGRFRVGAGGVGGPASSPVRQLFEPALRQQTWITWAAFFGAFMTLYFLTSWIPRLATDAGLPLSAAIRAGTLFNLGAFVGLVLLGWLATRFSLGRMIAWFLSSAAVLMVAIGAWHAPAWLFYAGIFLIGTGVQGGFGGLYAVAAQLYPTSIRTTGIGWALAVGRMGAIAGPLIGGFLIGGGVSLFGCFLIFALPIAAAAMFVRRLVHPVA